MHINVDRTSAFVNSDDTTFLGNKYIPSNIDPAVLQEEFSKLDNMGGGTVRQNVLCFTTSVSHYYYTGILWGVRDISVREP